MTPLPLLASPAIGVPFHHGFTTRAGGVSAPPFDSLNLGGKWGDPPENVRENRRRLLQATRARAVHFASQVHGAEVALVRGADDPSATAGRRADAVCSDVPDLAVAVLVADCVPAVLVDPRTGAFAAVHAGWRGTVAGVLGATVAAMASAFGARPHDLRAALGPAIGACCFEVGPEVSAAFAALGAEVVLDARPGGKPHVDLRRAQRLQLERAGLDPAAIDVLDACTRCDPENRFFSYRRDQGRTGQHVAFVTRR